MDLAILYCAILEAADVETSIISTSDRFSAAFALQGSAVEVITSSANPDMYVYQAGKAWVPVDSILIDSGFSKAWLGGLELWREFRRSDDYTFTTTRDAWLAYPPPQSIPSWGSAVPPSASELREAVEEQVAQL
jgi:hypothetical protein